MHISNGPRSKRSGKSFCCSWIVLTSPGGHWCPWWPHENHPWLFMLQRRLIDAVERLRSSWKLTLPGGEFLKQDDRLAPAYFSPEYKYFDQHLSHSAEKLRRGILQCFISFGYQKMLGIREKEGGGRTHVFPLKFFCITVPKNWVRQTVLCCVSENFR